MMKMPKLTQNTAVFIVVLLVVFYYFNSMKSSHTNRRYRRVPRYHTNRRYTSGFAGNKDGNAGGIYTCRDHERIHGYPCTVTQYWAQVPLSEEDLAKLSPDERADFDAFLQGSGDERGTSVEADLYFQWKDSPLWDTDFFNPGGKVKKPYIAGFADAVNSWVKNLSSFTGTGGLTGTEHLNTVNNDVANQISYIAAANTAVAQGGSGLNTHH